MKNFFILLDLIGPNSAESKYARILIFEFFFHFTGPNWTQLNWVQICKNFNFWKFCLFYWTQLDPIKLSPNIQEFLILKFFSTLLDPIGPNSAESKYARILIFEDVVYFTGTNWTQFGWVEICKNSIFWKISSFYWT